MLLLTLFSSVESNKSCTCLAIRLLKTLELFHQTNKANQNCFINFKLERKKLVIADQVKKRPTKALQKCARDFADGLLEYIFSENENYKYVLIATKENANMLMKEVLSLSLSLSL